MEDVPDLDAILVAISAGGMTAGISIKSKAKNNNIKGEIRQNNIFAKEVYIMADYEPYFNNAKKKNFRVKLKETHTPVITYKMYCLI